MIDYIIIGLLVVCIILLLINLFKKKDNSSIEIIKNISEIKTDVTKSIGDFKYDFSKSLQDDFESLNVKMEKRLNEMNDKVNLRLDESFDKTNRTFNNVLERLTKIDEAQKNIDILSKDIVNLQSVLTDKKTRGTFGEVNLNYILTTVFGEKNIENIDSMRNKRKFSEARSEAGSVYSNLSDAKPAMGYSRKIRGFNFRNNIKFNKKPVSRKESEDDYNKIKGGSVRYINNNDFFGQIGSLENDCK